MLIVKGEGSMPAELTVSRFSIGITGCGYQGCGEK